jgi:predicted TIM-barrel fold metal-dependent hydrolase
MMPEPLVLDRPASPVMEDMQMRGILWLVFLCLAVGCGTPGPGVPDSVAFEEMLKIDVHSHIFADSPEFVEMMERTNLRIINICVRGTNLERMQLAEERAELVQSKYPNVFHFASTFDVTRREEEDYVEGVKAWLDQSFEAGAVMTKIWKEVGMEIKHPDGTWVMPDDPVFDPIYAHLAKNGKPLIAHLAEPIAAWSPLDPENVHYGYYSNNPEWHFYGRDDVASYEEILAARDRLVQRHPDLTVIGAHLGSMSHDVDEVAKRLDRFPNFFVEVSARTKDLSRQPREKVREFFEKYQDRILYGVDLTFFPGLNPDEEPDVNAAVRNAEARYRRDYRYYAGTGKVEIAGKEVDCLELPRPILEKFYHQNARRLIPGLRF